MHFVYVKLPAQAAGATVAQEQKIHEALDIALTGAELGGVLGWGASLSDRRDEAPAHIAFHRVDIEVAELQPALALLRRVLVEQGAVAGTEIHYSLEKAPWQDELGPAGWLVPRPTPGGTPRRGRKP